jgi:putative peptidoglycan lipid II flippase
MTQRALIAYSVGLLAIIVIKVLAPGFYAQQNIRTPVKIAIFTLVCTQLLNLVLIGPLAHAGLAWRSAGACLNAGLLFWKLRSSRCSAAAGLGLFLQAGGGGGGDVGVLLVGMHFMPAWDQGICWSASCAWAAGGGGCGGVFRLLLLCGFRLRHFNRKALH